MTIYKLGTLPDFTEHLIYDDEAGAFFKAKGVLGAREIDGGFRELSTGDF